MGTVCPVSVCPGRHSRTPRAGRPQQPACSRSQFCGLQLKVPAGLVSGEASTFVTCRQPLITVIARLFLRAGSFSGCLLFIRTPIILGVARNVQEHSPRPSMLLSKPRAPLYVTCAVESGRNQNRIRTWLSWKELISPPAPPAHRPGNKLPFPIGGVTSANSFTAPEVVPGSSSHRKPLAVTGVPCSLPVGRVSLTWDAGSHTAGAVVGRRRGDGLNWFSQLQSVVW